MPGLAHVHNALLYRDEREVAFFSANDRGDSSLFEPKHHTGKCIRRTTKLDAVVTADPLFQARGRVRLLKLEAEGAEPEILEGGSTVLPCCDYITADLGPERGASQETTLIPVIEGLAKYGFKPIRFGLPRCVMLFDSSSESDATQRGVRFRKDLMRAAKTRGVDRPPRREACRPLQRRDIPRARRAAGDLGYLVVDKAIHGLCSLGRPVESRGFRPVGSRRILRRQACSTVCYTLQIIFVGLRRRSWNRTFAGERHVGAEDARMETKDGLTYLSAPATVSMGDAWFDVAHVNHFWITRRFAVFDRLLRRCGRPDSSSSIGEIGCGSGIVQEQMRTAYGAHVDGFDLNEYALTHPVNPRNARFLYDIHERQEPLREKYDFLILFDVIEHIDDESHFIDSVLFHLRSGGSLAVNVPALQWLYSAYDRAAGHVRRYSVRSLQAAFESRGMKTIADTYWGLPYMPLLLARKALLGNTQVDDATIRKGFSPRGGIGNAVLGGLGRCEWLPQRLLGTSAMAIFRKS
jgi:hypothetical protein